MKSPDQPNTTSTKDGTAQLSSGIGSGFGGIKLMHCRVDGSPPVAEFSAEENVDHLRST